MLIFAGLGTLICVKIARGSVEELSAYPTEINRLIIHLGEDWDSLAEPGKKAELIPRGKVPGSDKEIPFDYSVIDRDGNLLLYTRDGISTSVSAASAHYDVIRDIEKDGDVIGRLLVHNPYLEQQRIRDRRQALMMGTLLLAMLLFSLAYFLFLRKRIVKPFDRMKHFAKRVAAGDLDTPLLMDRGHVFGAFTESFDIMREELRASREREAEAVRSRKELVAELSHDIKTPVASIKAMADVMSLTAKNDMERETIEAINGKADQIDHLISNLFHATLEELEQLEVNPEDVNSSDIRQMVREADHRKRVTKLEIKDAVVRADALRLNQVISNIIANSYKYAGTDIEVGSRIERKQMPAGSDGQKVQNESFLVIEISDRGGGVPEAELELITQKFKRGSNATGKDGSGLGLYLSGYFMEKMEGSLECLNRDGGFTVRLKIPMS